MRSWKKIIPRAVIFAGFCWLVSAGAGSARNPAWQGLLDRADSLVTTGDLDSASAVVDSAIAGALIELGRSDSTVGLTLYTDGTPEVIYFRSFQAAESLLSIAASVKEKMWGSDSPELAPILEKLAEVYLWQSKCLEAQPLYERTLRIREAALAPDHPDIARSLRGIAGVDVCLNKPAEAESLLECSLSILGKSLGPDHQEIALAQWRMARAYRNQGQLDSAYACCERALQIWRKSLGPEHIQVARVLADLADVDQRRGMYVEAESLYAQSLQVASSALGSDDPDVAPYLNRFGEFCSRHGRYAEAESLHMRALAIRESALGPEHPSVADNLTYLGQLYEDMGKYTESEELLTRALAIREKSLGSEHPLVGAAISNLAGTCWNAGELSKAQRLYERELAIDERLWGPDDEYTAGCLENLANVYSYQGKYTQAEQLYLRALDINEKVFGPEHQRVALVLSNLGDSYRGWGRYDEAEALIRRALTIRRRAPLPDERLVASELHSLAVVCWCLGRYDEADSLARESLEIQERELAPGDPDIAYSLTDLANVAYARGNYDEAAGLMRRALDIMTAAWSPENIDLHWATGVLAHIYTTMGEYSLAESLFTRAIRMAREAKSGDPRVLAYLLASCSRNQRCQGDNQAAFASAQEAYDRSRAHFGDLSGLMSEREALTYGVNVRYHAANCLSIYFDGGPAPESVRRQIANIVLSVKGQASEPLFLRAAGMNMVAKVGALDDSVRAARALVSDLYVGSDRRGAKASAQEQMADAARNRERLEAELTRVTASYNDLQATVDVNSRTIMDVLNGIPGRTTLVEYVSFDYGTVKPDRSVQHYAALVIDRDSLRSVVDLGPVTEIDTLVTAYRSHMIRIASSGHGSTSIDQIEYRTIATEIYRRLWEPLEHEIQEGSLVLIAPDGGLNLISFAGLLNDRGTYLIEQHSIHYLSSGRDLIRLKNAAQMGSGLLALGDPDYDATTAARTGSAAVLPEGAVVVAQGSRNVRSSCARLQDLTVEPLPGTRREVETIAANWKSNAHEPLVAYLGPDASEEKLKAQAPGRRIIHIATHGYFLEGACQQERGLVGLGASPDFIGENPLLLSGLFLAGGNLHGAGADSAGCEDGILTAEEVTAMNLLGTQMAVLSACETGLGEVKDGEGVYGLRRAFQMAGVRTVISALWPVSDRDTAEMMSEIYDRRTKSLPEALRNMQTKAIREIRLKGQPDHPFTWAPFIAVGDWR